MRTLKITKTEIGIIEIDPFLALNLVDKKQSRSKSL